MYEIIALLSLFLEGKGSNGSLFLESIHFKQFISCPCHQKHMAALDSLQKSDH